MPDFTFTSHISFQHKCGEDYTKDWRVANHLAYAILIDTTIRSRDFDLALKATTLGTELTRHQSSDALAMHTRALFAKAKKEEAIDAQKKAIALCRDPKDKPELEKLLAYYENNSQEPAAKKK